MPRRLMAVIAAFLFTVPTWGAEPAVHLQIDKLIQIKAGNQPFSAPADDAEFLRRAYLDLIGRIPTTAEARAFLDDKSPTKRTALIDTLLAHPEHPQRLADLFHVMFMERLGDHADWSKYLLDSFRANKPWNTMAAEILRADGSKSDSRGAAFFVSKRLENYGQNPVDYPALTRDIGRLFLGKDLRCAECHDHLFIEDYTQADFKGLFAFTQNAVLQDAKSMTIAEKLTTGKIEYMSVFKKQPKSIGPRVPGMKELDVPVFKKGEEYAVAPDPRKKVAGVPKFSPLSRLAEQIALPQNPAFARNFVNRIWFVMIGRGLVHPLDLDHSGNPPSHPEVLDLLAREFVTHKYDIRWLVRELLFTQVYQRSSMLPANVAKVPEDSHRTALEKRLSAEQMLQSLLTIAGDANPASAAVKTKFLKAFANPAREPEDGHAPALKSALLLLNDDSVLNVVSTKADSWIAKAAAMSDADALGEVYLRVLTRRPDADEGAAAASYLAKNKDRRPEALSRLAWALIASTEFCVNH